MCCLAVANDGFAVLVDDEGAEMGRWRLPGACFSSPAVVDAGVVVGCRDNSLYCLRLSAARSASSRSSGRHCVGFFCAALELSEHTSVSAFQPQMDARER